MEQALLGAMVVLAILLVITATLYVAVRTWNRSGSASSKEEGAPETPDGDQTAPTPGEEGESEGTPSER